MTLVVVVVALVVAIATYLTWLAGRLDRLSARVADARGGLVTQLVARADAARDLAVRCELAELRVSAEKAGASYPDLRAGGTLDAGVEETENALSRALRSPAVAAAGQRFPTDLHAVDASAARVALARQFHNDAVRDLRALSGRSVVRRLHLAGRRPLPGYFEIDDALPLRDAPPVRDALPVQDGAAVRDGIRAPDRGGAPGGLGGAGEAGPPAADAAAGGRVPGEDGPSGARDDLPGLAS